MGIASLAPRPGSRCRAARGLFGAVLAATLAAAGCGDPESPPPPDNAFKAPSECATCHPNHYAEWNASMHAYSFKDPVFFALNDAEKSATGGTLGKFCISCHSPIAAMSGATDGEFDPATLPEVMQAGVSCEVCHTMRKNPLTQTFDRADESGARLILEPGDDKLGPMDEVVENTFHRSVQEPLYDLSEVCLPCHNVALRGVTLEGTFDEWSDSPYSVMGRECQDCHMPEYSGQAAVGGPIRQSLHRHDFTGVDVAMTPFPDREAQKARVAALLEDTAELSVAVPDTAAAGDTIRVRACVRNANAGHSLPSGTTFERQMWLEVVVTVAPGETLFVSGNLDSNGDLRDRHSELDPDADPPLTLWSATIRDGTGDETVSIFRATEIESRLIAALASDCGEYDVGIPAAASGTLHVSVRLLFRPFAPYILRERGVGHLQPENPIFEMERFESAVALTP